MDKTQIIILVMNAVITMVTTAVVIKLSLNQGKLGIIPKVKAMLTTRSKIYTAIILSLLGFLVFLANLILLLIDTNPPNRFDVLWICLSLIGSIAFSMITAYNIGQLKGYNSATKQMKK